MRIYERFRRGMAWLWLIFGGVLVMMGFTGWGGRHLVDTQAFDDTLFTSTICRLVFVFYGIAVLINKARGTSRRGFAAAALISYGFSIALLLLLGYGSRLVAADPWLAAWAAWRVGLALICLEELVFQRFSRQFSSTEQVSSS